jgi:hypothetical protein
MKSSPTKWQYLLAEPYTWLVTTFFGAVMLDVVYFGGGRQLTAENAEMVSNGADFLLLLGGLTVLAGLVAVISTWGQRAARWLFLASLGILLLEFIAPLLLGGVMESIRAAVGVDPAPWVRVIGSGAASILAFLGLWGLGKSNS